MNRSYLQALIHNLVEMCSEMQVQHQSANAAKEPQLLIFLVSISRLYMYKSQILYILHSKYLYSAIVQDRGEIKEKGDGVENKIFSFPSNIQPTGSPFCTLAMYCLDTTFQPFIYFSMHADKHFYLIPC